MFVDHRRRFVVDGALPRHGNLDAPLGREIHHRHGAGLAQRVAHGGVDDLPHGLLVVELHLDFLGMDIDVDPFGVDRKEEEIGGETGIGNQLFISFQHRLAQVLVAEIASVDEEVLLGIALFGRRRTPHEPVDTNDRRVGRNLQQIGFDMATHHVDDPPGQRSRLQTVYGNIIVVQLERHGGIAQRHALEFGLDLFRRRGALLQKPPSRRYVVKQVAHVELRSRGTHHRLLALELAAVDRRLRTHLVALLPRAQFDLCDGRDRSERLAAETERMERIDVLDRSDLARGMTVEGHAGIHRRHAASVVDDLDQLAAAVARIDRHGMRTGVDRILHHLLHHRRRTVDHFACGDLVGYDVRQEFDSVGHTLLSPLVVVRYHRDRHLLPLHVADARLVEVGDGSPRFDRSRDSRRHTPPHHRRQLGIDHHEEEQKHHDAREQHTETPLRTRAALRLAPCGTRRAGRAHILPGHILVLGMLGTLAEQLGTTLRPTLLFGIVVTRNIVELVGVFLKGRKT